MKVKYLNYRQAAAMANDYQILVGKPFSIEQMDNIVKQVLVSPYSQILQWQFLRDINRGVDPNEALQICRDGRFDVLVLPEQRKNDKGAFLSKDLRTYLKEHNEAFEIVRYN